MSIKFKVIERGEPGVVGGGTKKYYATSISSGEMSLEEATEAIEESSTVSGADIRAVLYALVSLMSKSLAKGEIVRLGDLGSLRMSVSSKAEGTADEVSSSSITGVKTIFTPGARLQDAMRLMKYEKVS